MDIKRLALDALTQLSPSHLLANTSLSLPMNTSVFGSGKAAITMANAITEHYGVLFKNALLITHYPTQLEGFEVMCADHPYPTERSVNAGRAMYHALQSLQPHEHFLYLLSGGSSALLELPYEGISLDDLRHVQIDLMKAGASINELNVVRKQCSYLKGGGLANATAASGTVLAISDVIGDDPSIIASGPFSPDPSTPQEALEILKHYRLLDSTPPTVLHHLAHHHKPDFTNSNITYQLLASNYTLLKAIQKKAAAYHLDSRIITHSLQGEAREVGTQLIQQARHFQSTLTAPLLLIYGGETTVHVRGEGKGGRNQELALSALLSIQDDPSITLLSLGSDGKDGSSDAAGAIVNAKAYQRLQACPYDPFQTLLKNDSFTLLNHLDATILTGPTGMNVADVVLIYITQRSF